MKAPVSIPFLLLLCFYIFAAVPLSAQTSTIITDTTIRPKPLDLPQWVRDLRRAEIVAFGSFPFTMFFVTTAMDITRYASHGSDVRYAPWPFKSAGAVAMTTDEHVITLVGAIGGSLLISLADYLIVRYKRHKAEQALLELPTGSPIIIRRTYPQNESASGSGETGSALPGEAAAPGTP
jgi:hypothetical protein